MQMPSNKPRSRKFGLLTYALVAVAIYVLYLILSARPTPSGPMVGPAAPGKLPTLAVPGGNSHTTDRHSSEEPKTNALSSEQKSTLLHVLPSMGRIVHLDMKGAAPKLSYLAKVLPIFKALGATGLLIEWEDTFPYDGDLESIAAGDCYSKDDVKKLLALAKNSDLLVIPLVQTFGHMEFVLKGEKFKHLRENPKQPQVINPHKEESMTLLKKMIDQQLLLQPGIHHLHIGCDEVWGLGNSPESKEQIDKYGLTTDTLFLNHVREVAGYIKNTYPYVEIMMWDDMFRHSAFKDIEKSKVNKLVTPIVWRYTKDVDKKLKADLWYKYSKLFTSVWAASAFKGATGSDQYLTDISHHYENHMGWLRIIAGIAETMNVRGIMLTGWQRYDHFSTLCELLPVTIPSLAVCLSAMQNAGVSREQLSHINSLLGCQPEYPIQWAIDKNDRSSPLCSYPGHRMLEGVYALKNAQYYANSFSSKEALSGWHKDYNMDRNFAQHFRMKNMLEKCVSAMKRLNESEAIMNRQLPRIFSEETHMEWIESNIKPLKNKILTKMTLAENALKVDTWPRRPIHRIPKAAP